MQTREPLQPRPLPQQFSVGPLPWNHPGGYGWGTPLPYVPYGYPSWYMQTPWHGYNPTGFGGQAWGVPQPAILPPPPAPAAGPSTAADASTPTTEKKTRQPTRSPKATKKRSNADGDPENELNAKKHCKV